MPRLKYVLREWHVVACMGLYQIVFGFALALPAIIAPTLAQVDSDIRANDTQIAWYLSSSGIMMLFSNVLLPAAMQIFGRKCAFNIANCSFFIGSIVIAKAYDITSLIIGRAFQGFGFAGVLVNSILIAEFMHPEKRSTIAVLRIFITYAGLLTGHIFGSKLAWRQLSWLSAMLISLNIIATFLLPESPAWLAYKGRYDDCARSFKYVRGEDTESLNELNELIAAQRKLRDDKADYGTSFKATLNSFKSKEFLKLMLIAVISLTLFEASGCNYIIVNLVTIMTKMTQDQSTGYYFTMGFDIVRILSVVVSFVLVRIYNRKTILIWSGSIAYIILCLVCISYYLSNVSGHLRIRWLAPSFLLLYESLCSSGFYSVILIYHCEIYPLKFRGLGATMGGFILALGDASTSRLTPFMFQTLDIHGTFGIYLVICVILLPILYYLLPETKNKRLQEIENEIVKIKLDKLDYTEEESETLVAAS